MQKAQTSPALRSGMAPSRALREARAWASFARMARSTPGYPSEATEADQDAFPRHPQQHASIYLHVRTMWDNE